LEISEEKMISIAILIGSTYALRQILKLSADKGKLFILNGVVKPVMIPIFIPLILIANNWNFSVTTIFPELEHHQRVALSLKADDELCEL
jgi:hypothetical protein